MAQWCVGVDLGGTSIKFGLLDDGGRATETFQLPTPVEQGADAVVARMIAGARQAIERREIADEDVLAVGIGAPGPLDIDNGVVIAMPNISGMDGLPLRDSVAGAMGKPGFLANDANAAALGEYLCGAGRGTRDMVMLTLGTGVGSGIIIDGELFLGAHKIGGELGHMIVQPGGELCGCGQRGCLERHCSATYMAQHAHKQISEGGRESSLAAVLAEKGSLDARDINEARKAGDALAGEVWDRAAYYIGLACVNICRILDPQEVVLAGGMAKAGDDLLTPVREHFTRMNWALTDVNMEIVLATLGSDAGTIGAAGVAWQAMRHGRA